MVRGTISRAEVMGACVGFGEIEKNAALLTVELGEVSGIYGRDRGSGENGVVVRKGR